MKIAIIGYGKMGRMIEEIVLSRGHEVAAVIDVANRDDFHSEAFRSADVAIEFSAPSAGYDNIMECFKAGVPVVSGTTGFADRLPELKAMCDEGKGTLLHSTNFSIGVYLFRAVNRYLAGLMSRFPEYRPFMSETHHIHKLDHPSGTAITLADELVAANDNCVGWYEPTVGRGGDKEMPLSCIREGEVPGIHTIKWESDVDYIAITHSAKSRRGFAAGAVYAAEWLAGKRGWYSIADAFNI